MKTLVIIAHPDPSHSSLQSFLKESCRHLSNVSIIDIAETIQSIDVSTVHQLITTHDRLIFQFPMYWYAAPDILYKWIENIFTPSLYKEKLKGKEFGIVINTGQKLSAFQAGAKEHFTIPELLRPFQALAYKCQMTYLPPFTISLFSYLPEEKKKELLIAYQQYLTKENKDEFKSSELWMIDRLEELSSRNLINDSSNKLTMIKETIENNRIELDTLLDTLQEMREDA